MVRIITDTTSGLPEDTARQFDVPVIPQVINFGSESYLEGVEISHAAFMQRLKASRELPKTAAPPPSLFIEQFQRLVPTGEPILCIHPSSELSGTVRSAITAAAEFPGADIRVIDTRLIAGPLGTLVALAAGWARDGLDADSIEARVRDMAPRGRIYFSVATLEYLARGGRIGGASALLGSVLQVKPILALRDGRVDAFERVRTGKRACARLKELVMEQMPRDGSGYLSILHAGVPDQAEELIDDLRRDLALPETPGPLGGPTVRGIPVLDLPPAIVTHGGPGLLAVAFFVAA